MKLIFLSVLCSIVMLITPARAMDTLLFVADKDFAPYSMLVEGEPAGIDVDVLTEVARRAGIDLKIAFKSWETVVSMVKNGECDGATSFFKTPDREQYAMFMDAVPIHVSDYVIFTKVGGKFPFRTYEDLRGKILGKVSGMSLGDEFDAARTDGIMDIKEYQDVSGAVNGLLEGEIDGFVGNMDVTYNTLKPMGMTSSIVYLPKKVIDDKPSYAVFSRASGLKEKDLIIRKFEHILTQMREDGTYNTIAKRYLFRF
ncbi:transporter substrate-binding domain-containing protein [uncultured Pseudodesulfovibrio sp.]|uniref:substrate-binding periplasmic protein n=1 Tax=uncultured Pseudodesulfovibrio sp. TaxID=2035858 RepID=UPI0029C6C402|nr:transporter substrate-binding domain-containing protein [uncultured Pseudodesulfovibrio sp.]